MATNVLNRRTHLLRANNQELLIDFPKHEAFTYIPVTAVEVNAQDSVVTRNIPVIHDDKYGLSADENYPSILRSL